MLWRPHLNVVVRHDGVEYTNTNHVHKLFQDKDKVRLIREQDLNRRIERNQIKHDDTGVRDEPKYG